MHTQINEWAKQWRTPMIRFARLHLSNLHDAEDAVQEAFAAMLTSQQSKEAPTEPRAYLFGVLRHKVMDKLRHRYKNPQAPLADPHQDLDERVAV